MKRLILLFVIMALAGCSDKNDPQVLKIRTCAEAIPMTGQYDVIDRACDQLSKEEQDEATDRASHARGIDYLPPYAAKTLRQASPAPVSQPDTFDGVRDLALKGDYQAQRNLAFGYSDHPYPGQDKNPLLACAWRTAIIHSGNEKVDETDIGNQKVYCDRLGETERQASDAQAEKILGQIGKR